MKLLLPCTDRELLSVYNPYRMTVKHHDVAATRYLVDAGIDVNADCDVSEELERRLYKPEFWFYELYSRRGNPLVATALSEVHIDQANTLLEAGAYPDAPDLDRVPPLLIALASMDQLPLVRVLISAGASVNVYHPRVIGNMSLVVSVHCLQCLDLMLRCGAEPDSLFHRVPVVEAERSDDSDMPAAPMSFCDVVAKAHPAMRDWRVKFEHVLLCLLLYSSSVSLDDRLAGYCKSESEWHQLKALAGSSSLCARNC